MPELNFTEFKEQPLLLDEYLFPEEGYVVNEPFEMCPIYLLFLCVVFLLSTVFGFYYIYSSY